MLNLTEEVLCENCGTPLCNSVAHRIDVRDSIFHEMHHVCSWSCYATLFAKIREEELAMQKLLIAARLTNYCEPDDPDCGAGL